MRLYGEQFGLADNLGDSIGSFSHGMKQKLALMGALIHDPKLLILDEPFVGLDPWRRTPSKSRCTPCARAAARCFSPPTCSTWSEKLCDQVAIIKEGALVALWRNGQGARRRLARRAVLGVD